MENNDKNNENAVSPVIGNIVSVTENGKPFLKSSSSIFYDSFYFQDYYDDALIKRFIKSTERLVRQSKEYTEYLALIKANYSILTYDNILSHIGDTDASIEFHHYPFSLYDIIDIIMNYHLAKKDNFTSFSIAKEVMELHYRQMIGFVPLDITNHELAHNGNLFISTKQIFGNWPEFVEKYKDGMSQEQKSKIETLKDMSAKNAASDFGGLFK